ncbi:MAG: hypothetical protein AAGF28_02100 [Pseudomonadota bacterium]
MIKVSQNQFAMTTFKACLGAGVERGAAQEMSAALTYCVGHWPDDQAIADLLVCDLVAAFADERPFSQQTQWRRSDDGWHADKARALADGPSFVDLAVVDNASTGLIDHANLIAALAAYRSTAVEKVFELRVSGTAPITAAQWLSDNRAESGALFLSVCDEPYERRASISNRVYVGLGEWRVLNDFANRLLVAPSARTLNDAGAGLTDND